MKRSYLGLSTEKDHGYTYVVVASSVMGWNNLVSLNKGTKIKELVQSAVQIRERK